MAQFYRTAEGGIANADSFMYQPPVELMKQALDYQNQGITTSLASANLYNNLNINYIDDERERDIVKNIVSYYSDKSKEIQDQIIKDPSSWQKLQPTIQALGAELQKDMTTGDISRIQGSYNSLQKWMTDNAEMKTKNPALYQQGLNHYISSWRKNENRSLDSQFSGTNLVSMPDIMQEKYRKIFDDVKANAKEQTDGTWIYQGKTITKEKLLEIAQGLFMSDEAYKSYAMQQTKFGDRGWVDVDGQGNITAKSLYVPIDTETGRVLTNEELKAKQEAWEAMTPEQQKERGNNPGYSYGMNKSHEMYTPINTMASAYSFMESTIKENPYGLIGARGAEERRNIAAQGAQTRANQNNQGQIDIQKMAEKYKYDVKLLDHKSEIAMDYAYATSDKDTRAVIDDIKNKKAIGQINNTIPVPSYPQGFQDLFSGYNTGNPADLSNFTKVQKSALDYTTKDTDVQAFLEYATEKSKSANLSEISNEALDKMIAEYRVVNPMFYSKMQAKAFNDKKVTKNLFSNERSILDYSNSENMIRSYMKDKYIKTYANKLDSNTEELNNRTDQVTLYPLSDMGTRATKQFLDSDRSAFIAFDTGSNTSKSLDELGPIKTVLGGSLIGGKGAGFVRVQFEDGTIKNVMPSQGKDLNNGYNVTLGNTIAYSAKNLGDQQLLLTQMAQPLVRTLANNFSKMDADNQGKKTMIQDVIIEGKNVPLTIESTGSNKNATFRIKHPISGDVIDATDIYEVARILQPILPQ